MFMTHKDNPPESQKKEKNSFFNDRKKLLNYILDIIINGIIIVGLVLIVRTFLISPFQVSGQSMCNTLNYVNGFCLSQESTGEYIIIDKISYRFNNPVRGDVIVFRPPVHPDEYYVKRIIGLPGEKIQIKQGKVWIINDKFKSGYFLNEPYLNEINLDHTFTDSRVKDFVFEVPENSYFVLGDNRNGSSDSRHWRDPVTGNPTPYVTHNSIDGKVWLVLWPFKNIRVIKGNQYPL